MAARKRRKKATRKRTRKSDALAPHKPRVDLRVAHGDITEVDTRAVVLGLFQGVEELSGAVLAIDRRVEGAITEITRRRMFTGRAGEVFILPAARHNLRADYVVCVGMGRFDEFDGAVLETTGENVARTLTRAKVRDFATVLFGASRGKLEVGIRHLVDGFLRGARDTYAMNPLRSITICERDPLRCKKIADAIVKLDATWRSDDIDVSLERISLPAPAIASTDTGPTSIILQTTQTSTSDTSVTFRLSVLGAGSKATVPSGTKKIKRSTLDELIARVNTHEFLQEGEMKELNSYGKELAQAVLPRSIASILKKTDKRVIVVHDLGTSRMPWETLCIEGRFPALEGGMSRQHMTDHMPVARWLEQRRVGKEIDLLLIVNPTGDLDGAEIEGKIVREAVKSLPGIKLTELRRKKATKARVEEELESGKYDVLHYAGHTAFYPDDPDSTGIVCYDDTLSGKEVAGLKNLPALVFFNSCESGRVGGLVEHSVGLAQAFLRGGVANYVGTHWELSDAAAPAFMTTFYGDLLKGAAIGTAVHNGRKVVRKLKCRDWADYIHFGSPSFALKLPQG